MKASNRTREPSSGVPRSAPRGLAALPLDREGLEKDSRYEGAQRREDAASKESGKDSDALSLLSTKTPDRDQSFGEWHPGF